MPERARQQRDGTDDLHIFLAKPHLVYKALIDLQTVEGQTAQVAQRRVTGTEIVELQADVFSAQPIQQQHGIVHVLHQDAFGDLEAQPVGRQPRFRQDAHNTVEQIGLIELPARQIHADPRTPGPTFKPSSQAAICRQAFLRTHSPS